jgi:hypothetical protein
MKSTIPYRDDEEANPRTFRSIIRRNYSVLNSLNPKKSLKIIADKDADVSQLLKQFFEQSPQSRPSGIMLSRVEETK